MTATVRRMPLEKDHEFLPGGFVRCVPHDVTLKGRALVRHSWAEHRTDTIVRGVLQVGIFMAIGAGGAALLQHLF